MTHKFDFTKISGAIFDMDGTILDSSAAWDACPRMVLHQCGREPRPDLDEKIYPFGTRDGAIFLKHEYDLPMTEEEVYNTIMSRMDRYYEEEATLKPGAVEFLQYLKARGVKLCLATATAHHCVKPALKLTGILDLFDHVLTCEEIGHTKQEPHIFQECLDRMGTPPESTWLFEDALHSIRTAGKLGMILCGAADSSAAFQKQDMLRECHFFLEDLQQWKELPFVDQD